MILSCVETQLATETDNDLNKELDGYGNIVVAEPIAVISQDLAGRLDNVPLGFGASDCILYHKRLCRNPSIYNDEFSQRTFFNKLDQFWMPSWWAVTC